MTTLDVNVVALADCLVSPGWRLSFPGFKLAGLHYNLAGHGQMTIGGGPPISLAPHTLVIIPPGRPFHIDTLADRASSQVVEGHFELGNSAQPFRRFVVGDSNPELIMICGYFQASYGASIDLFATQLVPIVEQFDANDQLASMLKSVVVELATPQVGMRVMAATLLKQVIVTLLRRSLQFSSVGIDRFSMLRDARIAHVFAEMVATPGATHSVGSLSKAAELSRSVFMMRFVRALGCPPMIALRQLRMRQAAHLLVGDDLSIEDVARAVGYASRSSFFRAFHNVYGIDPSSYRKAAIQSQNG